MKHKFLLLCLTTLFSFFLNAAEPPKAGDKAPDFSLKTLEDQAVRLSELTTKGKVVLVVLRGWPGYQCPICTKQVAEFVTSAPSFQEAKTQVVFVYPGPADELKAHAKQFQGKIQWPKGFHYVTDPDYTMVNAYNLRWDAEKETAYPSTFVLDDKQVIRFAKVSKSHGGRTQADAVLQEVKKIQ
jgi:peroxiredoxin Q/BCP